MLDRLPAPAADRLRRAHAAVRAGRQAARAYGAPATDLPRNRVRTGAVDLFDDTRISGWVADVESNLPARITLWVNDQQVAATWAGEPTKHCTFTAARAFHFRVQDLWDYCRRSDRVTVRLDGVPLPIAGRGTFRRPPRDGEHGLDDLRAKLDQGHLFGQWGALQLSKKLDTEWQHGVIDLYERVSTLVRSEFGLDLFLVYGSLLGYVREGGFIGHDNDFDAAYISTHSDPGLAATELRDIALRLIDGGFDVECKMTALHISDPDRHDLRIDLFHLFFDHHDALRFPFGVVGTGSLPRAHWTGVTEGQLAGRSVAVPANAREFVAHIYGPAWEVPVVGFSWDRERARHASSAFTRPEHREEVYWANFYARHEIAGGSSFNAFVSARDDLPRTVLDIGCGDGRDSFAFARQGRRVHGIDRSQVGIRHAGAQAAAAGLSDHLSFSVVDVSDATAVRAAVEGLRAASGGGPILFYLRFFLHSIPEDVQDALLTALSGCAGDADVVAIEFRTEADAENRKVHGGHYRRYQDGPAFGRALRGTYGFDDVRFEVESAGLATYRDEDPVVYRVIAGR